MHIATSLLPPVVLYFEERNLPQISEDGAITPIPYIIDFFSIQIAIGSRIRKQGCIQLLPIHQVFQCLTRGGGDF